MTTLAPSDPSLGGGRDKRSLGKAPGFPENGKRASRPPYWLMRLFWLAVFTAAMAAAEMLRF